MCAYGGCKDKHVYLFGGLSSKQKSDSISFQFYLSPVVPKGTYTEVKQCDSIAELFGQLSCCMQPTTTVASARNLICETASLTVSETCPGFGSFILKSPPLPTLLLINQSGRGNADL